jgi:uncharacterized protein (TIGR00369 family)
MDEQARARRNKILRTFAEMVPHNKALGIEILELDDARTYYRLPYDPRLVGNPETGVLHGGVITTLLDSCCGAACFGAMETPMPLATLDLRIDYLHTGEPGRDVLARAHCYKTTRNVAFVRATAFHEGAEDNPIASAVGTFMLGTKMGTPGGKRA